MAESKFGQSFAALLREYGHKHINDYGVELAGAKAALVPEPDNPFDADAVAVWVDGRHQVGYLARDNAARYAPKLDALDKGTYLHG